MGLLSQPFNIWHSKNCARLKKALSSTKIDTLEITLPWQLIKRRLPLVLVVPQTIRVSFPEGDDFLFFFFEQNS